MYHRKRIGYGTDYYNEVEMDAIDRKICEETNQLLGELQKCVTVLSSNVEKLVEIIDSESKTKRGSYDSTGYTYNDYGKPSNIVQLSPDFFTGNGEPSAQ